MRAVITCLALVEGQLVLAQPAIYKEEVLTIPQGAVVDGAETNYFENIQLQMNDQGNFVLIAADPRALVAVDSVEAMVMESLPVQVSVAVSGNKSVPCVDLLTPSVSYADNSFVVTLAESALGPAESCIAVIEPFETSVALDVEGLQAGTYQVSVNGVKTEFTLQVDN